jgi:hypothetical protein
VRPALGAWLGERFPARNAVFFIVFYLTGLVVARAAAQPGAIAVGWRDIPGGVALWCFFLTLRIADEHKDFAADSVAHPQRVLQRGLITLPQLRVVGACAAIVQIATCVWLDGGIGRAGTAWLAAMTWSALMAREFFARDWLRPRLMVYALSHLLVMPLVALWIAAMAAPNALGTRPVAAFAVLALLAGLAFEIARKIRAPEVEHPLADSYTQSLGVAMACIVLLAALLGATAAGLTLTGLVVRVGLAALAVSGAATLLAAYAIARFGQTPTVAATRRAEAAVGVATLVTHLVPVVTIVLARGVGVAS